MAALLQTMFVQSPPTSFPHSPKILSPVPTFEGSTSYIHTDEVQIPFDISANSTQAPSIWPFSSLLGSSPLQSMFGSKKQSTDEERQMPEQQAKPSSRAGQSIEALRSSLDLQCRPSPPRKPHQMSDPQTTETTQIVDTLVFNRNPRSKNHFKPQKTNRGTSSWQLRQFAEATLGSGSLRKAVRLPEGEDLNEWLAVNVVDFYNQINLLYGSITEFCSPQTCPEMKATDEFEYLWQDSDAYRKPTKMPAPEYIEHLMTWCQSNIDNEALFPSRIGVAFPKTFPSLVRQMFKRLYRVYAHVYCHHYSVVQHLGLEPHLNTSFKHYVLFVDEHQLASGKDYWGPLGELVDNMLLGD